MQKGGGNPGSSGGLSGLAGGSTNSNHSNSHGSNSHGKNSNNNSDHHHHNPLSQFNDFLKSTFNFSSSSSSSSSNSNSNTAAAAASSSNNSNNRNTSSAAASPNASASSISPSVNSLTKNGPSQIKASTPATNMSPGSTFSSNITNTTNSNSNTNEFRQNSVDYLNTELTQQLTLDTQRKNDTNANIPNCAKCINAYTAITEDEITVQKGDIVQIITANMHNRFLVHREASEHQPAAEGWIPGFVIGFQSTNSV